MNVNKGRSVKREKQPIRGKGRWLVRHKLHEGVRIFMPGGIYDGSQLDRLDEKHPWVKARWLVFEPAEGEEK